MRDHRLFLPSMLAATLAFGAWPVSASAQPARSAIATMQAAGPEVRALKARAGEWDVTITITPEPGAKPMVSSNLKADRRMIGGFLEEVIAPRAPKAGEDFRRISFLHYNRVEGRWQYVSMDTRFPAGIMPAWSSHPTSPDRIELEFEPIAFPGWGETVDGWMLRSNYEVSGLGSDHEIARQYWVRANGTSGRWLAVQFDYRRRGNAPRQPQ